MNILPKTAGPVGATVLLMFALTGCGAGVPTSPVAGPATSTTEAHTPDATPAGATPTDGTGSSAPASSGDPQACSLLTEQELTPLLGSDPGPGTDNSANNTTACAYTGAGAVTIVVDHGAGRTQFEMFCPNPPQKSSQNVAGIADGACLTIVGNSIAAMYILKRPAVMSINIQAGPDAKITPDALIALGKIAADRI